MTLDKDDKKEFVRIVGQVIDDKVPSLISRAIDEKVPALIGKVIDEKVTPRLKRVEEKLDATMEMTAKNTEDITMIKEDLGDLQDSNNSIETLVKHEIKYVDKISTRVLKLETKPAR